MSVSVIPPQVISIPAVSPASPMTVVESNMTVFLNLKNVWNLTNIAEMKQIYAILMYCVKHRKFDVTINGLDASGAVRYGESFGHYDSEDLKEFMHLLVSREMTNELSHVTFTFFDKMLFHQVKTRLNL